MLTMALSLAIVKRLYSPNDSCHCLLWENSPEAPTLVHCLRRLERGAPMMEIPYRMPQFGRSTFWSPANELRGRVPRCACVVRSTAALSLARSKRHLITVGRGFRPTLDPRHEPMHSAVTPCTDDNLVFRPRWSSRSFRCRMRSNRKCSTG